MHNPTDPQRQARFWFALALILTGLLAPLLALVA